MTKFEAVVIGAGNAGLVAATKLEQNGIHTLLLERHNIPGGCATTFRRGNYEFEVSLHQLSGIGSPEKPGVLRKLFDDIRITDKVELIEESELYRIIAPNHLDLTLPSGVSELQLKLQDEFPHEHRSIESFFDTAMKVAREYHLVIPHLKYSGDSDLVSNACPSFCRYGLLTTENVLNSFFKDRHLKNAIAPYWTYLGIPTSELTFAEFALVLIGYILSKPCHVKGGSQSISSAILDSFSSAGGAYRLNCGAAKISTEKNRVTGVLTESNEFIECQYVVSNASPLITFGQLLGRDPPDHIKKDFRSRRQGVSAFCIYLGLDCSPDTLNITTATTFIQDKDTADITDKSLYSIDEANWCTLTCYNFVDPELAPNNKSIVVLAILQYAEPWIALPKPKYFETKNSFAKKLVKLAEKTFPDIGKYIEVAEIASPLTMMRYLNSPGGAIYGFKQNIQDTPLFRDNLSDIEGLFSAGSWTTMGGFQPTYLSGDHSANQIIKKHNDL